MGSCVDDVDTDLMPAPRPDGLEDAEQLVERYGERFYRLAVRITGVADDAEEAVGDALSAAIRRIHSFTDQAALESWIYRTVARAAFQKRRQRHPRAETVLDAVVDSLPGKGQHFEATQDWSPRLDEPAFQVRLSAGFAEAIDALPAEYRTALILHDVEGASKPDIAEILDTDVSLVRSRVHDARLLVRRRLSEYFEAKAGA